MTYRIGTRRSRLALAQAELVRARLAKDWPEDAFEIVPLITRGDREATRPLVELGDAALFTAEIERALAEGRIDIAVHSMKDLPPICGAGLVLAKAWPREDPRDALVTRRGETSFDALPVGATVATGSPRRRALLRHLRPDLNLVGLRGNVDTRLRKLFEPAPGEPALDALVLAAAGLRRLGLADRISATFDPETFVPAPNQGTLALEIREDDVALRTRLDALGDADAEAVTTAERLFLRELDVDCHSAVGAFATLQEDVLTLRAVFARSESDEPTFVSTEGHDPADVARRAANAIRRRVAGIVTLVGAGPGDPDLITVKGLAALREADTVIYDYLVPETLLAEKREECECIAVGKTCGCPSPTQDEINALLAKKALVSRRVVRLKGGDPFVFGRGGEEMAFLAARGIACRVVPGVTSAIAAPAAAGIPVTHRGLATSFEIITARERENAPLNLDFTAFLHPHKTFVVLMGLTRLEQIAEGLLAVGCDKAAACAVVSSATTPDQRSVVAPLGEIVARVKEAGLVSPAVFVFGPTVALRRSLGLVGKRVLVPQVGEGPSRVATLLRHLGVEVDAPIVGRITPLANALAGLDLAAFTWIALTSRHGALALDARAKEAIARHGIRLAAIGAATAEALVPRGLKADFVSPKATTEGFVAALRPLLGPHDRVLHLTVEGEPPSLAALAETCAYRAVAVYRNEAVALPSEINLSVYDAAIFTCGSSARRILARARGETRLIASGPATQRALLALGAKDACVARESSAEALVEALVEAVAFSN